MKKHGMKALAAACREDMDEKYDLVYVAYDDKLTDEQIVGLVRGEELWEERNDFYLDWLTENQYEGAKYHATDLVDTVISRWERETGKDFTALADKFKADEYFYDLIDEIRDRDVSDPLRDLAHKSGQVLMRQLIVNEDYGWSYEPVTPTQVLTTMKECAEEGTVLKRNAHNLKVARDVLRECSPEFSHLMGMIVYAVDVGDIYDLPYDTEYVDIINPYLYLGNPFMGDGYCDGPLDGTIRVKREDMTTDRDAFGYGWDEVAGVYTSAYSVEIKAVPKENGKAA